MKMAVAVAGGVSWANRPLTERSNLADNAPTRDQKRSRARHATRATTISPRSGKREVFRLAVLYPPHDRPKTRADCIDGPRPCPYVGCKYNLYLDVTEAGGIKMNFPDLEPDELVETCALDVADRGGETLEEVGALLNIVRERIRQVEATILGQLREDETLRDYRHHDCAAPSHFAPRRLATGTWSDGNGSIAW